METEEQRNGICDRNLFSQMHKTSSVSPNYNNVFTFIGLN